MMSQVSYLLLYNYLPIRVIKQHILIFRIITSILSSDTEIVSFLSPGD